MRPYLVKKVHVVRPRGHRRAPARSSSSQAVSADTAAALTRMMEAVVKSGTGKAGPDQRRSRSPARPAPPSTPSASRRTPGSPAFAPSNDPKIAVAVVVEDGGNAGNEAAGGRVAAPIAKAVMEAVLGR